MEGLIFGILRYIGRAFSCKHIKKQVICYL